MQRTQTDGQLQRPPGGSASSSENGTDHRTSPVSGSVPRRSTPPRWYRAPMAQCPAASSATSAPALGVHDRSAPGGSCSGLSTPGTSARYSRRSRSCASSAACTRDQPEQEGGAGPRQPPDVPSDPRGRPAAGGVVVRVRRARRERGARARPGEPWSAQDRDRAGVGPDVQPGVVPARLEALHEHRRPVPGDLRRGPRRRGRRSTPGRRRTACTPRGSRPGPAGAGGGRPSTAAGAGGRSRSVQRTRPVVASTATSAPDVATYRVPSSRRLVTMVPATCQSRSPVRADRPLSPSAPPGAWPTVNTTSGAEPSSSASQFAVSSMGTREPSASRSVPAVGPTTSRCSRRTRPRAPAGATRRGRGGRRAPGRRPWSGPRSGCRRRGRRGRRSVSREAVRLGAPRRRRARAGASSSSSGACRPTTSVATDLPPVAGHRAGRPPCRRRRSQPPAALDLAVRQHVAVGRVEHPDRRRRDALDALADLLRDAGRHVRRPRAPRACRRSRAPGDVAAGVGCGVGRSTGVRHATTPVSGSSPTIAGRARRVLDAARRARRRPPRRTGARARARVGPPEDPDGRVDRRHDARDGGERGDPGVLAAVEDDLGDDERADDERDRRDEPRGVPTHPGAGRPDVVRELRDQPRWSGARRRAGVRARPTTSTSSTSRIRPGMRRTLRLDPTTDQQRGG